jgi:hypothetical protein
MAIGTTATALTLAGLAATGATGLGSAKIQSGAAGRAARLQTDAANRAAELQRQTAADQLAYIQNQARMDRESQRWADRQNYGLSKAEMMNRFSQRGDTAYNLRASELSRGRSDDKRYGATQQQLNTMRALMGMGDKPLVSYVEPDALRLTAPTLPDYVEDPTQEIVDDEDVAQTATARRRGR